SNWAVTWRLVESGRLLSLAFASDGRQLACGIGDAVRLYEIPTGRPAGVAATHDGEVTAVEFTPDGGAIVSGGHDRSVLVTELPSRTERLKLCGYWEQVNSVAVSRDGKMIASGSSDIRYAEGKRKGSNPGLGPGGVRLWEAATGRLVRRLGNPLD